MEFNQAYDPIRALKSAWKAIAQAPVPLLVGGGLLVVTGGGGGGGGVNFATDPRSFEHIDWQTVMPIVLAVGGIVCCVAIAFFVFSSWVKVGLANTVEEVLRTGQGDVGHVFDAKGRLLSMVLSRLLCAIISSAAILPWIATLIVGFMFAADGPRQNPVLAIAFLVIGCAFCLPALIYIVLGLALADQAVALEGARPVESIRRSWSLVAGHRWMLLWYSIATGIFSAIGVCLCCVGVFLTGPMAFVAQSESFLALTRGTQRGDWWIEKGFVPPPPPQGWGAPPPPPPVPA